MDYTFKEIEKIAKEKWQKLNVYKVEEKDIQNNSKLKTQNSKLNKFYVLDMFPYPSGSGLHVGHPLGYIASDIYARYKRHLGHNVLHPMGFDAFGLPAEQYAIQTGQHPAVTTEINIKRYKEQLDKIGLSYDWNREVKTTDPKYYKWTQWIFLQLFQSWYDKKENKAKPIQTLIQEFEKNGNINVNAACDDVRIFTADEWKSFSEKEKSDILMKYRLAYHSEAYVNWCPALGTVLANDEVKDGVSERGGFPVERKLMPQWSLRITAYADRLLEGLERLDWSESIKEAQRNWIGKSEGAEIEFKIPVLTETSGNEKHSVKIFTTRPDTIFGVTYIVLAPEHPLIEEITTTSQKEKVLEYVQYAKNRSERERQADVNRVTGVFTGAEAIHPFTNEKVPIWIADYVLYHYGTGAVMAVPAHDSRDYRFAKHFNLPIKQVIQPPVEWDFSKQSYDEKNGICINSDFLNGLSVKDAIQKCIEEVENRKIGKRVINYKLRDAVFGRQRYWGEPIPIYYDENNIPKPVDEKDLPIELPEIDKYLPTETGEPPLARANNWKYKGKYEFEKTTMPGWAGSSWYFLRYMDPHNYETFASKEKTSYWNKVDVYVGGSEHATGHLLYARFWTKFLYDLGYIDFDEPFQKLINQGMILGESAILLRLKDPEFTSNDINKKEFFKVYEKDFEIKYDTNGNISSEKFKLDLKKFLEEIDKETKQIFGNAVIIRFKGGQNNFISSEFLMSNKITEAEKIFSIILDVTRKNENRTFEPYESLDRKIYKIPYGNLIIYFAISFSKVYVDVNSVDENDFVSIEKLKAQPALYGEEIKFISDYPDKIKCHREVEKMSKSKMNVINPDDLIDQYGADTFRLYEMFLGPIEQHKPFITNGITGTHNFLKKVWKLFHPNNTFSVSNEQPTAEELRILHKTIKKIREDIDKFSFNTCVSSLMILVNKLTELKCNKREILEPLVIMLSPFAPYTAEYLWTELGHETSVVDAPYPEYKEEYIIENTFNYPISFNGKTRFNLELPLNISKEEVEQLVLSNEQTKKYLKDLKPKKFIFVEKKIVNIVV